MQILLIVALLTGAIGITLTATGVFDPTRAGDLRWQLNQVAAWDINPGARQMMPLTQPLPAPPFTLEIDARFSTSSDPAAQWRILLQNQQNPSAESESVGVDGSGNYWHGDAAGRLPFPHVRPPGQLNQITIDVDSARNEMIRINQEVAWRGSYPLQHAAGSLTLIGLGGWQATTHLDWSRIALFAP